MHNQINQKKQSLTGILFLFAAAFFWGTTFVAQSIGAGLVEPNTYLFGRSLIGGTILIPVALFFQKKKESEEKQKVNVKKLLLASLCCGGVLFLASFFQQFALKHTTVAKSGFITALYIILVPLLLTVRKIFPRWNVLVSLVLAVVGLYFLCFPQGTTTFKFSLGDSFTLICALLFATHILVVAFFVDRVSAVWLACLQLWFCALFSGIAMILFENPNWPSFSAALPSIFYAGIFSSGIAYTCQIMGQRKVEATIASLIMSLEAVISVLSGWLILGQTLSLREIGGCTLMFVAILLAQKKLPPQKEEV